MGSQESSHQIRKRHQAARRPNALPIWEIWHICRRKLKEQLINPFLGRLLYCSNFLNIPEEFHWPGKDHRSHRPFRWRAFGPNHRLERSAKLGPLEGRKRMRQGTVSANTIVDKKVTQSSATHMLTLFIFLGEAMDSSSSLGWRKPTQSTCIARISAVPFPCSSRRRFKAKSCTGAWRHTGSPLLLPCWMLPQRQTKTGASAKTGLAGVSHQEHSTSPCAVMGHQSFLACHISCM